MKKLLVIVGPTSSGKSAMGVRLAKKFNGEIISGDSRQVYTYADIGTGKISRKEMEGVPHHCLDFVHPKKQCSLPMWKREALAAITDIHDRGKLPILVGGTAFYIYAITNGLDFPEVPPNLKLRKELSSKTLDELLIMLEGLDPERLLTIQEKNKRRIIRAIEIVKETGSVVPKLKGAPPFDSLILGIERTPEEIKKAIHLGQQKRFDDGILNEIIALHKKGLPWKRIAELGLDYRYLVDVARKKTELENALPKLHSSLWKFTKQQMNWWKRDADVVWIRDYPEAEEKTKDFLE